MPGGGLQSTRMVALRRCLFDFRPLCSPLKLNSCLPLSLLDDKKRIIRPSARQAPDNAAMGKERERMKNIQRLVAALFVLFLSALAAAQTAATADLHGTIKDPNGAVIQGATVTVRDESRNVERSAQSNGTGYFTLLSLPPGNYTMTVTAKGFAKLVAKN